MYNPARSYEHLFVPTDGGYIFYPSKRHGGHLITVEEHDSLVAEWGKFVGLWGTLKFAGAALIAFVTLYFASPALGLSAETESIFELAIIVALFAFAVWKFSAPHRLVRGRTPVVPPRSAKERRQAIRQFTSLPALIFAVAILLGISALMFWSGLQGSWVDSLLGLFMAWLALDRLRTIFTPLPSSVTIDP